MSGEYDNTNTGSLFKNDKKTQDKHPTYRGSINIEGREYWLSAWIKDIKRGERAGQKFMSLAAEPKDGEQGGGGGHSDDPF